MIISELDSLNGLTTEPTTRQQIIAQPFHDLQNLQDTYAERLTQSKLQIIKSEENYYKIKSRLKSQQIIKHLKTLFKKKNIVTLYNVVKALGPKQQEKNLSFNFNTTKSEMHEYFRRQIFTDTISWAVPNKDCIEKIVDFINPKSSVLEIGCGSGFWAALLKLHGIEIYATDNFSSYGYTSKNAYLKVKSMNSLEAVYTHRHCNTLLSIWPPYNNHMADDALIAFSGDNFIYIGDIECTGTPRFHEELSINWKLIKEIVIEQWFLTNDKCYLYMRK